MPGHDKTTQGRIWSTLEVCEARSRTSSNAGVSRHGVRLLSKVRTLVIDTTANLAYLKRRLCLSRRNLVVSGDWGNSSSYRCTLLHSNSRTHIRTTVASARRAESHVSRHCSIQTTSRS